MELLSVAQLLRGRRLLVSVGLVAAVVLGAKVSGVIGPSGAAGPITGQAVARVVIDTRVPLVATATAQGADTVVQRSVLLAALMGSNEMTAAIARQAGLPPGQLAVVGPSLDPVSVASYSPGGELPQLAVLATNEMAATQPFVVELRPYAAVPIISVSAAAPDVRQATALTHATIATLKSASAAPSGAGGTLRVEPLGPVRSVAVTSASSSHHLLGMAVAVAVLLAWCTGIVMASGLARLWRRAGRAVVDGGS
jgi:hypothetical protein